MVCSRLFDFRWNTIYRKNNSKQNNIYIVTGTNKWGLSNGSIAAIIITDLITKNSSEYEELYKYEEKLPIRINKQTNMYELESFICTNMNVANISNQIIYKVGKENIVFY